MRETLFRGKSSVSNEWVYGNLIKGADSQRYIIPYKDIEEDGHHLVFRGDNPVFTIEKTIGQYTWFKDSNGVRIFEGDIIAKDNNGDILSVIFNDGKFVFRKTVNGFNFDYGFSCIVQYDFEIIGNIHENHELLKGE